MFDRRDILKLGSGVATAGLVSIPATHAVRADDAVFSIEPDQYETGAIPDGVVTAGEGEQAVTDDMAAVGDNAYTMIGEAGGCSETLARADASFDTAGTITGYLYVGDGEAGCYDVRGGLALQTVSSQEVDDGPRLSLFQLEDSGTVAINDVAAGSYAADEWLEFSVVYEQLVDTAAIKRTVQIGDSALSVSSPIEGFEDTLSAIELQATDHTLYWDDVRVFDSVEAETATFIVGDIDGIDDRFEPDEEVRIHLPVENTGDVTGIQSITTEIDGAVAEQSELELEGTDEFILAQTVTVPSDPGEYEITVSSADDQYTDTIDVGSTDGPELLITNFEPTTVTADPHEEITFTVDVENIGEATEQALVDLLVDGSLVADAVFPIDAGAQESVTFSVTVPADGAGDYPVEAITDADTAEATLTVSGADPDVAFEITEFTVEPSRPDPGETVDVSFTVTNTGVETGSQTIEFRFDGELIGEFNPTLSPDDDITEEFTFDAPTTAGTYGVNLITDDDDRTDVVTVTEDKEDTTFEIIDLFPRELTVSPDEPMVVGTAVENAGDTEGEAAVELFIEGDSISETTVSIQSGRNRVVEFEFAAPAETGTYEYTIETADDSASGSISVIADGEIEITDLSVPDQVDEASQFTIEALIENETTEMWTDLVVIEADIEDTTSRIYEEPLELSAGAQATITTDFTAPRVDTDTQVTLVITAGEAAAETVMQINAQTDPTEPQSTEGTPADTEITVPGFTVPGTIASIGAAAYLMKNRLQDTNE